MNGFVYNAPTKVYFGTDSDEKLTQIITESKCSCVLLHYGSGSAVKSGLIKRVKWALEHANVKVAELGGVKPNPRLSLVYEGIEICKREGVDFILAVGGGSVIDSAKAIGMGAAGGGDVWDYYDETRTPEKTLPVGVILTVAAAGSEMSKSSVITNDKTMVKRGRNAEISRPVFAILNPELTVSVPPYPTACGCADIFMHTLERYLTGGATLKITDNMAEALMTTVISASKKVIKNPADLQARADIMWAGALSHNGLTGCGNDGGDWCTHSLGHELSVLYDVAHGASLTAVWGTWARYVYKNCLNRFHKFAVQVMGVRPNGTREELALKGIEYCEEWFESLGLPVSVKGLGVNPTDGDLKLMAEKWAKNNGGEKGSCKKLRREDAFEIYSAASR